MNEEVKQRLNELTNTQLNYEDKSDGWSYTTINSFVVYIKDACEHKNISSGIGVGGYNSIVKADTAKMMYNKLHAHKVM